MIKTEILKGLKIAKEGGYNLKQGLIATLVALSGAENGVTTLKCQCGEFLEIVKAPDLLLLLCTNETCDVFGNVYEPSTESDTYKIKKPRKRKKR